MVTNHTHFRKRGFYGSFPLYIARAEFTKGHVKHRVRDTVADDNGGPMLPEAALLDAVEPRQHARLRKWVRFVTAPREDGEEM